MDSTRDVKGTKNGNSIRYLKKLFSNIEYNFFLSLQTTSVDIFSLGCVFYYVLSKGHHPFGEPMRRQSNILSNEYNLSALIPLAKTTSDEILSSQLIADMINHNPNERPTAAIIRIHPIFWSEERVLAFLQDVSDRVEKSNANFIEPLKRLEKNAQLVVRDDWSLHLDYTLTADMKKYRGYQGTSVRDLLRAIRNKVSILFFFWKYFICLS